MPYNDDENHSPSEFYHPEQTNDPNKGPFIVYTSGGHRREIGWVTDF